MLKNISKFYLFTEIIGVVGPVTVIGVDFKILILKRNTGVFITFRVKKGHCLSLQGLTFSV